MDQKLRLWQILPIILSAWLLAFNVFVALGQEGFLSIDCGATESYTDDIGILWLPDDDYISTGENGNVEDSGDTDTQLSTVRAFPTGVKNCYALGQVEKGSRYLVRALFHYGNYDSLRMPPTFDLLLDANTWATVTTSDGEVLLYEAILVSRSNSISICVARTSPDHTPFISSLELRLLGPEMYSNYNENYALFLTNRINFGGESLIRYPDDPFDRHWDFLNLTDTNLASISSDFPVVTDNTPEKPPSTVMQTAVVPDNSTATSILIHLDYPNTTYSSYVAIYFAELDLLDSTQTRTFIILLNGNKWYGPMSPEYQSTTEIYGNESVLSGPTTFTISRTGDSTLVPLLNAIEIYRFSDVLQAGTFSDDVETLDEIQKQFNLEDWSGDPCLPANYSWEWLSCSDDKLPRVTALFLDGYGLEGSIPDLNALKSLEIIHLQNNSLSGDIPESLASLPNLKELNLADNNFTGVVPESLVKNKKLSLSTSGNPFLCLPDDKSCKIIVSPNSNLKNNTASKPSKSKGSSKVGLIIGLVVAGVAIWIIVFVVVYICIMQRRTASLRVQYTNKPNATNGEQAQEDQVEVSVPSYGQEASTSPVPFMQSDQRDDSTSGGDLN